MKQGLYSKYKCDNKLNIYNGAPLNNYQYRKMIDNAKPRYMNDYYNAPKFNKRKDEKNFHNILDNYFVDFRKIKKKFNLDTEQNEEEYSDEKDNYFDYEQFQIKKNYLNRLFLSYDLPDKDEINFDLTDNIINSIYNKKSDSLLRNTQTKDDYDLRLNNGNQILDKKNPNPNFRKKDSKENNNDEINTDNNIDNNIDNNKDNNIDNNIDNNKDNNIDNSKGVEEIEEEDIPYLDDENQFNNNNNGNYLILNYNKKNSDDLPLFKDIINSKNGKKYDPPIYQPSTQLKINKKKRVLQKKKNPLKDFQDMAINNNYILFEQIVNPHYPTKYIPQPIFPIEHSEENYEEIEENEENDEIDYGGEFEENENKEKDYDDFVNHKDDDNDNDVFDWRKSEKKEENEEDENLLKLINNQEIKNNNNLLMFDNIISSDFKEDYVIPSYKMPYYIEKQIEKEEEKRKKEKEDYEKNKNIFNNSQNADNKMLKDIIKEEENPKVEDIINSDNKIVYNPPENFQNNENEEKNQNKNDRYSEIDEGAFIAASQNEDNIKNNMVENIINSNNDENYSLPKYSNPNPIQNEEEKNEDIKKEMMGNVVNYDNYKENEYPIVEEMVKKDYNEEEIKNNEKEDIKEEENNNKESLNNNINNNFNNDNINNDIKNNDDNNSDKIDVDELNDDEIEDNEENYGFD